MLLKSLKLPLSAVVALAISARVGEGQCTPGGPASPASIKGMIGGVVMDASHNVLEGADVLIRTPRRNVKTDARGRFFIPDLETGVVELIVRRIGYEIAVQMISVTDSGGVARFCLKAEPVGLAPVVTSVLRGGLGGVIGDTAYQVIAGAEVRVMGEGLWTLSDSMGGFHFPLRKGSYAVVVTKKGYGQQLVAVTIPDDSGRQIAVWLAARPANANTMANALEGIRQRIMLTPAHRYRMITAEDLGKTSMSAAQAAQVLGRTPMADDCEVNIGGTRSSLPLYMIDKADVLMLEVVAAPLSRRRSGPLSRCAGSVIAWLKP